MGPQIKESSDDDKMFERVVNKNHPDETGGIHGHALFTIYLTIPCQLQDDNMAMMLSVNENMKELDEEAFALIRQFLDKITHKPIRVCKLNSMISIPIEMHLTNRMLLEAHTKGN